MMMFADQIQMFVGSTPYVLLLKSLYLYTKLLIFPPARASRLRTCSVEAEGLVLRKS